MTECEKIATVQTLVGNDSEATQAVVTVYLAFAEDAVMQQLYPTGYGICAQMPVRYDYLQCQLAARYFLRRGAEGESVHAENGITRHYGSVDDSDLLGKILPFAEVR